MSFETFRDTIFTLARDHGAQAELYYVEGDTFTVRIDRQEVDSYTVAKSGGVGLRVQHDRRDGYAYTESFDDPHELFSKAFDNAGTISASDEHPMNGAQVYQDVREPENPTLSLTAAEKIELAKALERAALAADPRVERVAYDIISTQRASTRICNTRGLDAYQTEGFSYCYVSPVMRDGEELRDDAAYRVNAETTDVEGCAQEAVRNTARQFGGKPVAPGKYRVLWENASLAELLSAFTPMFSAERAQHNMSPLKDKEGRKVAGEVTIIDDPLYPKYPRAFDAEGTPSITKTVVERGVLKTLLHNLKTAKKAGCASTSNASRRSAGSPVDVSPSQFYIAPGEVPYAELVKMLGEGLIIRDVMGLHAGVNAVTGEFSLLAKGALVENGAEVRPVEQITVSGTFLGMLEQTEAVGNDLKFGLPGSSVCGAPSMVFGSLMVSGK